MRPDPDRDSTSLDLPSEDFTRSLTDSLDGLRIGIPRSSLARVSLDDVRAAVQTSLGTFEQLGAKLVPISLPRTELSIPVYYIIALPRPVLT